VLIVAEAMHSSASDDIERLVATLAHEIDRLWACGCRELRSGFRCRLCSDIPCTPRVQSFSAYRFVLHARARIPDCFELGNVDGLAVSVGLEEQPATQRFCTRAASRRAGRDGGGDRAAATQHVVLAHRSAASQAAFADRASDGADACCSAARIRRPRVRGGGGRKLAIGRGIRAERFRPIVRRVLAPSAPARAL
jgi:hypothetical protein